MTPIQRKLAEVQLSCLRLQHAVLKSRARQKYNPNHGPDGRFVSGGGAGGGNVHMAPDTGGGSGGGGGGSVPSPGADVGSGKFRVGDIVHDGRLNYGKVLSGRGEQIRVMFERGTFSYHESELTRVPSEALSPIN